MRGEGRGKRDMAGLSRSCSRRWMNDSQVTLVCTPAPSMSDRSAWGRGTNEYREGGREGADLSQWGEAVAVLLREVEQLALEGLVEVQEELRAIHSPVH
jgi:hypothetical protein